MKLYRYSLLALIVTVLAACYNNMGVNFRVINESGTTVDSLTIEPNVNTQYISIANNSEATYVTNMEGIAKIDGDYRLKFKKGAESVCYTFGYYTNGAPLEKYTTITLWKDTFSVDRLY